MNSDYWLSSSATTQTFRFKCPFCGHMIEQREEFWAAYRTGWPAMDDNVYHKDCWKPAQVAERLTRRRPP